MLRIRRSPSLHDIIPEVALAIHADMQDYDENLLSRCDASQIQSCTRVSTWSGGV